MGEPRKKQIVVNIESSLHEVAQSAAGKDNVSTSAYVRNLIIKDLIERGMMTDSLLARMLTG